MRKYRVGAYEGDVFDHWASDVYATFEGAFAYCADCIRKCAPTTGFSYHIREVEE